MDEKRCETCRWYDAEFYGIWDEKEKENAIGECKWPAENLPHSLRWGNRERVPTNPLEGGDCACWERNNDLG